jgi:glucose/mannose-6-phosphate isomerase
MADELEFEKNQSRGFIEGFSRKYDPKGMLSWVEDWPGIIIRGQDEFILKEEPLVDITPKDFDKIVMSGMGGSAIASDLIKSLLGNDIKCPIEVVKGYGIPGWVDKRTLFIAVSYSGNTEETLWNTCQAYNHGAKIIAFSSGGGLKEIADKTGFPFIKIYGQCLAPRAALGYLLMPMIKLFMDFGFFKKEEMVESVTESIKTIIRERKKYTYFLEEEKNFAKKLAREFKNSFPIFWAESSFTYPVALRWQQQINENSKMQAHCGFFPEVDHNEIMAYQFRNRDWIIKDIMMIVIRDSEEHPRISLRIDFTTDIIRPMVRGLYQVKPKGKSALCRLLSIIQVADYTSVYLALLNKTDPAAVNHIDDLKKKIYLIK